MGLVLRSLCARLPNPRQSSGCNRGIVSYPSVLYFTHDTFLHLWYLYLTVCRGSGGATMTEPVGGFAHAALSTMFNPPPPTSTSPPNSVPTIPPRPKKGNKAYISGIVIGAVTGIVIMVGLVAWLLCRRRRASHPFEMPGESAQSEDMRLKFRHSLVGMPPAELHEDQRPAELQGEGQEVHTQTNPSELPG
jgi:hypothetical protein